MRKLGRSLLRAARDEKGTALVEYSILLGVIAVACVTLAILVAGWSSSRWSALCDALEDTKVGAIDCKK